MTNFGSIRIDEPLNTFVSRLAVAHGASSALEFRRHTGITVGKSLAHPRSIENLANIVGSSVDELQIRTILFKGAYATVCGQEIVDRLAWRTTPRFCPECVANDLATGTGRLAARPYLRAYWLALSNDICVEHGTHLVKSDVEYGIDHLDFSLFVQCHAEALVTCAVDRERVAVTPADRYFAGRFDGSCQPVSLLDDLPYHGATRVCELIGAMLHHGHHADVVKLSDEQLRAARLEGFEIIADQKLFREFLSARHSRYTAKVRFSKGFGLYGSLQTYLNRMRVRHEFQSLVELMRDHAMSELPIGPEDNFLGGGGVRRWHTVNTVQAQTGVHRETLRKLLIDHRIASPSEFNGGLGRKFISVADVEAVVEELTSAITLGEAAALLGVGREAMSEFIDDGLVPIIHGTNKVRMKLSKNEITTFLSELIKDRPVVDQNESWLGVRRVCYLTLRSTADIVSLVKKGQLSRVALSSDEALSGIHRLLLDAEEVYAVLKPPSETVNFIQAADMLRVTIRTLSKIVAHGFLPTVAVKKGRERLAVRVKDLKAFMSEFVSSGQHAHDVGDRTQARIQRAALGAKPALLHNGELIAYFYRRSELYPA